MLEFKNVTYIYGAGTPFEIKALDDISIKIEKGKVTGLIGHSGSGKSTLVQLMNALYKPTSGTVLLNGEDINKDAKTSHDTRFKVGLVFQYPEYQLFEETVGADIAFGPRNMGLSEGEIKDRVMRAANFVGLSPEILQRSPFELSGGQKRRCAIAGVIAMDPEVLVLDEPAAGLDPRGRSEILGGLMEYRKKRGNSLVIVSHSMEDIAEYSDNIIAMSKGKILCSGTPHEVFSNFDILEDSGLSLPEVTEVMHKLKTAGANINPSLYTVDEAYSELLPKLRMKK
ncbi:MAG: energy-coupling factor transporter ATPase [Ruminococcaceae bacterium]|nr:energy-coupling factor transporter ATPase [Oscillospiraceae bacterium]